MLLQGLRRVVPDPRFTASTLMSNLLKMLPTIQGWRRAAPGQSTTPDVQASPLKLPGREVSAGELLFGPALPLPPGPIKLPEKPVDFTMAADDHSRFAEPVAVKTLPLLDDSEQHPEVFQLQYEGSQPRNPRRVFSGWQLAGIVLVALLVGYGLGWRHFGPAAPTASLAARADLGPFAAPTDGEQRELDAAFAALRSPRHAEAGQRFAALVKKHPHWTSLNTQIAIAALYANDPTTFERLINQGENSGAIPPAEGRALLGQYDMDAKEFEEADRCLGEAAGADPGRAETYFVWGECLLRWGKPNEAIEKFRAGRLRNPYPTVDNVYQTKLWLAEVESGLETTDGAAAQIDRVLASGQPTSSAFFAAAARAIKAGQFDQAASHLARARRVSEPATFRMMLQDPYFDEERWRPGIAAIYAETFNAVPAR